MSSNGRFRALREAIYSQYRSSVRPAAAILFIFGILITAFWYFTNDGSMMSNLLMLVGMSIVVLSFMLYVVSAGTSVRSEVSDAMSLSNTLNVGKMLSSLLLEPKGIYLPEGESGLMSVFVPVSGEADVSSLESNGRTLSVSSAGLNLVPPGYGLFRHSKAIGAVFTADGLEDEIKDVMVNGLELASSVEVRREDPYVKVSISHLSNESLCSAVRNDSPQICAQIGCPICSFVGCMVVSGMGRKALIESVDVRGRVVEVTFKLL